MDSDKATDAEKLFSETVARWLKATAVLSNFRTTFSAVAANAKTHLEFDSTEVFRKLHEDPQWTGILRDIDTGNPATAKRFAEYEELGKVGAKVIFESSYASLDAAALVFYHSLLDAAVFDYFRVTALHAPRDWEQDFKNSQVQLLETKNKSYDELLRAKLDERLERLERESLLVKADRLFARCNSPAGQTTLLGFVFDRERIEQFDEQRHEIVHGKALGKPLTIFPVTDDNLSYIQKTGMYFTVLVTLNYGLRLDPQYLANAT